MKYRAGHLVHGNMLSKRGCHHYGNPDIIWRVVGIHSPSTLVAVPYKILDETIISSATYLQLYKECPSERWYPPIDQIQPYTITTTIHTRLA